MRLLIYWYEDSETRKFLRRELIEDPSHPESFLIAWMTEGAVWKHYAMRRVSEERFEIELRKNPVEPGST